MYHQDHERLMHELKHHRQYLQHEADKHRLLNAHKPYQPEFYRRMLSALGMTLVRVGQRLEKVSASGKRYTVYAPQLGKY